MISCATVQTPAGSCPRSLVNNWPIHRDRLVRVETVEEAERQHVVGGVPFGALRADWEKLKAELSPGDQLWWFTRPNKPGLYGALEGYVVVRDCKQLTQLTLVWD